MTLRKKQLVGLDFEHGASIKDLTLEPYDVNSIPGSLVQDVNGKLGIVTNNNSVDYIYTQDEVNSLLSSVGGGNSELVLIAGESISQGQPVGIGDDGKIYKNISKERYIGVMKNTVISGNSGTIIIRGLADILTGLTIGKTYVDFQDATGGTWNTTLATSTIEKINYGLITVGTDIYRVGGTTSNGSTYLTSFEKYDTLTDTWTTLQDLPQGVSSPHLAYHNGKIYCMLGGQSGILSSSYNQVYTIATNTWTLEEGMPLSGQYIYGISLPVVVGDYIYLYGGASAYNSARYNYFYRFNTVTKAWEWLSSGSFGRANCTLINVGTKLYVFFGDTGYGDRGEVEIYDTAGSSWVSGTTNSVPRKNFAYQVIGNDIYFAGGKNRGGSGVEYDITEKYATTNDTWTTLAPAPSTFQFTGFVSSANNLYIFGSGLKFLYQYNYTAGTWNSLTASSNYLSRNNISDIINGVIYCVGDQSIDRSVDSFTPGESGSKLIFTSTPTTIVAGMAVSDTKLII